MTKVIAIYFTEPHEMGYPFDLLNYFETYKWFCRDIEKLGGKAYIVRGNSYIKNGIFSHGWEFADDKLIKVNNEIKADIVYNKGNGTALSQVRDCKLINDPELDQICSDKAKTVEIFPDISPTTFLVNSFEEYLKLADEFNDRELIVLKKNYLAGGEGIHIKHKAEIHAELYDDWNDLLVQEFMDSKIGIPGVVNGLHDLRITVVGGIATNALIRIPKEGMLLANISQGGKGMTIHMNQVPEEVMKLTKFISEKLKNYNPSVYAADFMNTQKGYKLIELNSRPGLLHPDFCETWNDFNFAVAKLLVESA